MFSLEQFYHILYINLLKPANILPLYFSKFGSTDWQDLQPVEMNEYKTVMKTRYSHWIDEQKVLNHGCTFWDQEPFLQHSFDKLFSDGNFSITTKRLCMWAISEKSILVDDICNTYDLKHWYYFFHGFAALDWYRDYQYYPNLNIQPSKVFMSLNRLYSSDRSYRLTLVSHFLKENLIDKGLVSLYLIDKSQKTWQEELKDPYTKLSESSKELINTHIKNINGSLTVDKQHPQGNLSAYSGYMDMKLQQSVYWHVVSETVFYYPKLHLTEKIFKPIVNRRPFILVGAPGNLAYLKSYGFKTFDNWIDESYDKETDPDLRIKMVVDQVKKLSMLSTSQLNKMHEEIKEITEYNFKHFFGNFKVIIVDELIKNLNKILTTWNYQHPSNPIRLDQINFKNIKDRLNS
jgi:hypothetical protein